MTDQKRIPPPRRRRSHLKRQRIALFVSLGVVALLTVAFILVYIFTSRVLFEDLDGTKYYAVRDDGTFVLEDADGNRMPKNSEGNYITAASTIVALDEESGEARIVAAVLTTGTETTQFNYLTYAYDVLLYPQMEMKGATDATCIQSIEIKNEKDSFVFYLNTENQYVIESCPGVQIDEIMLASLAVSTGYTRTLARLDLSEENPDAAGFRENGYAEYGLPDDVDDATTYFVITNKAGERHKVVVGNQVPNEQGYYVRYADRDDVYVLSEGSKTDYSAPFTETFFGKLEDFVTPLAVVPMGETNYFDVQNFKIHQLVGVQDDDWTHASFSQVVGFSYIPVELREGTVNATKPYLGVGLTSGYEVNHYNADDCLQNLQMMEPLHVVWLDNGRTDDLDHISFAKRYGCAYTMEFIYVSDRNGEDKDYSPSVTIEQHLWISPRTEDNTYFVYNDLYDMVTEVESIYFEFLEWGEIDWIEKDIFSCNIGYLEQMEMVFGNGVSVDGATVKRVLFELDNSASDQTNSAANGTVNTTNLKVLATYKDSTDHIREQVDTTLFRKLHLVLIVSALEGDAPLTEDRLQDYRDSGDSGADLVIRLTVREGDESKTYVYRFYNYTGRQTYVTVNGEGACYMLHKRMDKLITDAARVLTGEAINENNSLDGDCQCKNYS